MTWCDSELFFPYWSLDQLGKEKKPSVIVVLSCCCFLTCLKVGPCFGHPVLICAENKKTFVLHMSLWWTAGPSRLCIHLHILCHMHGKSYTTTGHHKMSIQFETTQKDLSKTLIFCHNPLHQETSSGIGIVPFQHPRIKYRCVVISLKTLVFANVGHGPRITQGFYSSLLSPGMQQVQVLMEFIPAPAPTMQT